VAAAAVTTWWLMLLSEDGLFEGRSDLVHRPAASATSLNFQNDSVVGRSGGGCRCVLIAVADGSLLPKLNHKGDSLGATQDTSLFLIVSGAHTVRSEKLPENVTSFGNLSVSNDERVRQSWVNFRKFGNVFFRDSPSAHIDGGFGGGGGFVIAVAGQIRCHRDGSRCRGWVVKTVANAREAALDGGIVKIRVQRKVAIVKSVSSFVFVNGIHICRIKIFYQSVMYACICTCGFAFFTGLIARFHWLGVVSEALSRVRSYINNI